MKTIKIIMKDIANLKEKYDNIRASIADDFNDNYIDNALIKIEELKEIDKEIKFLEGLEVDNSCFK